ncbi:hypothetical protein M2372_000614 [Chryseobacterium sp. BIGb0232]|nr:hypothetical protein [Chryseobacterium sp. BIGb0232]ROS19956.1 hypothetical protein EDF65_0655 [Chryseobacterium nakagawai]
MYQLNFAEKCPILISGTTVSNIRSSDDCFVRLFGCLKEHPLLSVDVM